MKLFAFDNGTAKFIGLFSINFYLCIFGSRSSTTNLEDNSDIASQEGNATRFDGVGISESSSLVINDLSGEAVEDVLTFGNNALALSNESVINTLGFGADALSFSNESVISTLGFGQNTVDRVFELSAESARVNAQNTKDTLRAAVETSQDAQNRVLAFAQGKSVTSVEESNNLKFIIVGFVTLGLFALLRKK